MQNDTDPGIVRTFLEKLYAYVKRLYNKERMREPIAHNETIPNGAVYIVSNDGTILHVGETFPRIMRDGDIYIYGDYEYHFGEVWSHDFANSWVPIEYIEDFPPVGWGARVQNDDQRAYGDILTEIGGLPVVDLTDAFYGCAELVKAPDIPNGVKTMRGTFRNCTALQKAPNIPLSVTNLNAAFLGCVSLKHAPKIHAYVTVLGYAFYDCASLRGNVHVDVQKEYPYLDSCFAGTTQRIKLIGACSDELMERLKNTATNRNIYF